MRFQPWSPHSKLYPVEDEELVKPHKVDCNIMPGEHLDLSSDGPGGAGSSSKSSKERRFVGVHFTCCDVYTRVYINRDETAYEGRCPKCAKQVRLGIGPGGTDSRFFTAG